MNRVDVCIFYHFKYILILIQYYCLDCGSILQFDAVQLEMPAASSSKGLKSIPSYVTSTKVQWINSV